MESQSRSGNAALRIVPLFYTISIFAFAGISEYLLRSGAEGPWVTPLLKGSDFQIVHIVVSVVAALLVALAIAVKRTIVTDSHGPLRRFIEALIRNNYRRSSSGMGVLLGPMSISEAIAVFGFVLFILGGGERVLCYPFYGVALLSLVTVLPSSDYVSKAMAIDEKIRKEMQG